MILFLVELGKPDKNGWGSFGTKEVYVLAKSYKEAEYKAINRLVNEADEKPSVVSYDGSLQVENEYALFVKRISIIADKIIQ